MKIKVNQVDFDSTVQTNIDVFDLPWDEAAEEAWKEMEMQGYDLSGLLELRISDWLFILHK